MTYGRLTTRLAVVQGFAEKGVAVQYLRENTSMAQGRVSGAAHATGDILLHLDSDMQLETGLVQECAEKIADGYDALVIPEESFGVGFWARCKWLEKKCYDGNDHIESLRCMRREVYEVVGGHNPKLIFSEDKDLDLRVRAAGYRVGRAKAQLLHNEGHLRLMETLKKKLFYADTADAFATLHPEAFAWQRNPVNRYVIFAKHHRYFFMYPATYIGMVFMKTAEYAAAAAGMLRKKI